MWDDIEGFFLWKGNWAWVLDDFEQFFVLILKFMGLGNIMTTIASESQIGCRGKHFSMKLDKCEFETTFSQKGSE